MKDTELRNRLIGLGMPLAKANEVAAKIRDDIHPRAAVASLAIMKVARVQPGLAGTGMQAVSLASTGAKAGSAILPGVGTAIGAAIGAIAGALIHHGTKPQRTAEAIKMMQDIRSLPVDFTGRLLTWDQFTKMVYALVLNNQNFPPGFKNWHTWEGSKLTDHPTSITNLANFYFANMRAVLQAALAAQPGAQTSVTLWKGANKSAPVTYTFVNPGVTGNAPTDYARIVYPALLWMDILRDGQQRGHESADHPDAQHVLMLATDKLLAELKPDTVSTTIANAPVAMIPASLAAAGQTLAQQYIAQGSVPSVALPPVPSPVMQNYQAIPPSYIVGRQDPGTAMPPVMLPDNTAAMPLPPTVLVPSPTQDATAGIMQNLVQQDTGANLTSPPARQLLADVAADGVEKTPNGPKAPAPGWLAPAGILTALTLLR